MKSIKLLLAAMLVFTSIGQAFAIEEVQSSEGRVAIGSVSASGALTLDDLTAELGHKAQAAGASSFRVVSAGGRNTLNGVAELYK
ncbi:MULTISPECIES: YdgH/BhsA/McbA-like domain containing protein [Mangrovibacter]|uniref:Multiple stress resistance protein BhsA n=1 Tax=Mangrovibacter plantisponsor TaxID=451513 RepID=A0A317QB33_9ENTR|nr:MULTISPECIES: YdgH/BhsA/McbA-like domain containing protein [Mangrovibacter]KEA51330.1 hypothetical protein DT73_18385 [Mangrovibacter sp. MFB070]PWW11746.1 multiple stress resistance protein BhsA [Mangrovibacter plantisponsor]